MVVTIFTGLDSGTNWREPTKPEGAQNLLHPLNKGLSVKTSC